MFSGAEAGSDSTAVLIVIPVDDVMDAFDTPMTAIDGQQAFGEVSPGERLVMPSAVSHVRAPDFLSMDSRSIRKTCARWGKSR